MEHAFHNRIERNEYGMSAKWKTLRINQILFGTTSQKCQGERFENVIFNKIYFINALADDVHSCVFIMLKIDLKLFSKQLGKKNSEW